MLNKLVAVCQSCGCLKPYCDSSVIKFCACPTQESFDETLPFLRKVSVARELQNSFLRNSICSGVANARRALMIQYDRGFVNTTSHSLYSATDLTLRGSGGSLDRRFPSIPFESRGQSNDVDQCTERSEHLWFRSVHSMGRANAADN